MAIQDEDTITVLDATQTQYRIRLSGIDTPQKRQMTVTYTKRDRHGRVVGKVVVEGPDVNLVQFRRGLAWHYKAYQKE